jgi:hypothetical protein
VGCAMTGIIPEKPGFASLCKFLVIPRDTIFTYTEKSLDIHLAAYALVDKIAGYKPEGTYVFF